jgi:hypothetical protein
MRGEAALFPQSPCFVPGDPEFAGFYGLELPDGFRWAKREAICRYLIGNEQEFTSPIISITAMGPSSSQPSHLFVSVNDQPAGVALIEGYGTYFFPLVEGFLKKFSAGERPN